MKLEMLRSADPVAAEQEYILQQQQQQQQQKQITETQTTATATAQSALTIVTTTTSAAPTSPHGQQPTISVTIRATSPLPPPLSTSTSTPREAAATAILSPSLTSPNSTSNTPARRSSARASNRFELQFNSKRNSTTANALDALRADNSTVGTSALASSTPSSPRIPPIDPTTMAAATSSTTAAVAQAEVQAPPVQSIQRAPTILRTGSITRTTILAPVIPPTSPQSRPPLNARGESEWIETEQEAADEYVEPNEIQMSPVAASTVTTDKNDGVSTAESTSTLSVHIPSAPPIKSPSRNTQELLDKLLPKFVADGEYVGIRRSSMI